MSASGYEADFSDEEGTGGGLSLTGTDCACRTPQMPNFWLIMQVHSDKTVSSADSIKEGGHRLARADTDGEYRVDVFFHTRRVVILVVVVTLIGSTSNSNGTKR